MSSFSMDRMVVADGVIVGESLAAHGLRLVDHVHDLAYGDGSALGARLLYVAMTRAVQVLHLVGDAPPPPQLGLRISGSED